MTAPAEDPATVTDRAGVAERAAVGAVRAFALKLEQDLIAATAETGVMSRAAAIEIVREAARAVEGAALLHPAPTGDPT